MTVISEFFRRNWPRVTSMVYIQESLQRVTILSTVKGWRTETFPGIDSQQHPFFVEAPVAPLAGASTRREPPER